MYLISLLQIPCVQIREMTNQSCLLYLPTFQVLICEDSGAVSIWSKTADNPWQEWMEDKSVAEHDDGALALDCLSPGKEYVTVGADGNAKVCLVL